VDPDGRWVHIAIGAAIGGIVNLATHWDDVQRDGLSAGLSAFGIGALAGGIGAATGGAAFAAAGGGAGGVGGFLAGAWSGASGGMIGATIQGGMNSARFGDPFSVKDVVKAGIIGGLTGGVMNGTLAFVNGRNFWNGYNSGYGNFSFTPRINDGWIRNKKGSPFKWRKVDVASGNGGQRNFLNVELDDGRILTDFAGAKSGDVLDDAFTQAGNTSTKLLPNAYNRFAKFEYHFGKHAGEFGAVTRDSYYKRALSFLNGTVGGDIQGFTNSTGYTFRMNMRTGEFGVMRPNGVVETFYRRLNDASKYWAEQVAKWNK
jgi:hypothetical protein